MQYHRVKQLQNRRKFLAAEIKYNKRCYSALETLGKYYLIQQLNVVTRLLRGKE